MGYVSYAYQPIDYVPFYLTSYEQNYREFWGYYEGGGIGHTIEEGTSYNGTLVGSDIETFLSLASGLDVKYYQRWYWLNNSTLTLVSTGQFVPTPTPDPNVTPSPTQDASCTPYGSVIDSPLIGYSPFSYRVGACYTILPAANFDVPEAVLLASPWDIPETLGVPGIDFCTQYIDVTMRLFGFDFITVGSFFVSVICAISIAREFRK
jgi:hypothetical protein